MYLFIVKILFIVFLLNCLTFVFLLVLSVIGSACTTDDDCSTISNANCDDGTSQCACDAGHTAGAGGTSCSQIGKFCLCLFYS